ATKDETSPILKTFIIGLENQLSLKNTDGDAAFDEKEPKSERRKPESKVNVSPRSSAHEWKDNLLSLKFKDFSNDSINEVNAAGTLVPDVGQISTNSTNTFSAVELEDISYFDDEDDAGVEADFNNLETSITVSPIPTTRVHKDHPVTQIIVRNKARLVAQGHTQEKGIDYKEVFALVARIEAIRLFLAYASFTGFMVYQMDVKSAFLYGTIKEEALYRLHQAPLAWYETLANYLLDNNFQRGKIDQTLFIKRQKGDILLVQIYVDDIIFGSTNKDVCKAFEKLMKYKFQMSSMRELTFFLDRKSASTPIDTEKPLLKEPDGNDVDVHTYRSMIGSLILISWQCKKQTVVASSSTEAEYVAAASCCAQVLWIQNQLLDYG
nr:hypothetical protein [Tanacetum cinerariifolium]